MTPDSKRWGNVDQEPTDRDGAVNMGYFGPYQTRRVAEPNLTVANDMSLRVVQSATSNSNSDSFFEYGSKKKKEVR